MRVFTSLFILLISMSANAVVRYVRTTGPNTGGTSWATAYSNIQNAINASAPNDEIWIASGTYTPPSSLVMQSGVKIYGGFSGSETLLSQRNFRTNVVVISGNNNKIIIDNNGAVVDANALLDGITLSNGNAGYGGGGMYNPGTAIPTLRNVTFLNNVAVSAGGGLYCDGGAILLENVLFKGNRAGVAASGFGDGGGFYCDGASPTLVNCAFESNIAGKSGGGFYGRSYMLSERPKLTNVSFANNSAFFNGAAVYNYTCQPIFTNCSFVRNVTGVVAATNGAGMHNYNPTGSTPVPSAQLTNCLFWRNFLSGSANLSDIYDDNSSTQITYSAFTQPVLPAGTGNIALANTSNELLVSSTSPAGADGYWFTVDDGLRPRLCNNVGNEFSPVIDRGNNSAIVSQLTDAAGQLRRFDAPLISNGGAGTSPIVDIGAYESQEATTLLQLTGSIGNAHTVPNPAELVPDFITNTQSPAGGMNITWQKFSSGSWVNADLTSPLDSVGHRLPVMTTTTDFRRVVRSSNYCNIDFATATVNIKVVNPNGILRGYVRSENGTPVQGITITARRLGTHNTGTPPNHTYTALTEADGQYIIQRVYYGDPLLPSSIDSFEIIPYKAAHGFNPGSLKKTLTQLIPQEEQINFEDTTVFSITGRVIQQCNDCNDANGALQVQTSALDSVAIWKGSPLSFYTYTGFIDTAYGRYAISVTDPGNVGIEPRFFDHKFTPPSILVNVTDNVSGINFVDTTTRVISGKITSGCNSYIGKAELEFTDVLPNDAGGNQRPPTFRKRVATVLNTGFYSVRLPARKYRVKVISFDSELPVNDPAYIAPLTLLDFVNNKTPVDSLTRDITRNDTVLNIRYERPPVLQMTGLLPVCTGADYALMQQEVKDSFVVKVFQGSPNFGCPVRDTNKIKIFTNIHKKDNAGEEFRFGLTDTGVLVKLIGGTPNILSPYFKTLNIQFNDRYGRIANAINREVVVTGVKADVATFTTVSPEVPLLVLHDPPGDASYSYWESNKTFETALRMYTAQSNNARVWAEAKIGTKFEAGLGVTVETSLWGTIGGELNIGSANTTSNETILTTSTLQRFETDGSESVTGDDGDVYVGAALNLIYAGSTEIKYTNCNITSGRKLIVANNGFATQYVYTEGHIRKTVIPDLTALANNPGNTPQQTANYLNQVNVWQQILDNNAHNKARASFDNNYSFDGSAGPITYQTTSSVSKSSTVEFAMSIDQTLALSLGFEIGGSGLSGGVDVNFKMETGVSTSGVVTKETTTGYVLDDNDNGDAFSVNVKKDPVYNTPVFELAAGTASCPQEENTRPRDEVQLSVPIPSVSGIPANGEAQFVLQLGNTSQSGEARDYSLTFDQSSNPNGAIITIGGSPVVGPIVYSIDYLGQVQVIVTVKRSASSTVFSYEGLRFTLSDDCGGGQSQSALLSAYFVSPCSNITLSTPEENWVVNSVANNQLSVIMKDYVIAGLTSVSLEYSAAGTSNWVTGFTRNAAQLNPDGAIGTLVTWNVSTLLDREYNLRLKLICPNGTVYSQRVSGLIDRKPPELFGNPNPTDDVFSNGDVISFSYNKNLDVSNLNNGQVSLRRLSNNTLVPITVTGYENKILITPLTSITNVAEDSFRVVVNGVSDEYGNLRLKKDTTRFLAGISAPATGNSALTVSIINPVMFKNADSTIDIVFSLPSSKPNDVRVNYSIAGTALYGIDYSVRYVGQQPPTTSFTGAEGTIIIARNTTQAILRIDPVADSLYKPDKTIIITLREGGDYGIGAVNSAIGTITSEDGVSVYTFIGDGKFTNKANWINQNVPLSIVMGGKQIIIDPSGVCLLNMPLTLAPGSSLTVMQGKNMIVEK